MDFDKNKIMEHITGILDEMLKSYIKTDNLALNDRLKAAGIDLSTLDGMYTNTLNDWQKKMADAQEEMAKQVREGIMSQVNAELDKVAEADTSKTPEQKAAMLNACKAIVSEIGNGQTEQAVS